MCTWWLLSSAKDHKNALEIKIFFPRNAKIHFGLKRPFMNGH